MKDLPLKTATKIAVIFFAGIFQFVVVTKIACGETLEERYNRLTPEEKKKYEVYEARSEKLQFPVRFGSRTMEDVKGVVEYLKKKDVPDKYRAMVAFMHGDVKTLTRLIEDDDRRYLAESLFFLGECYENGYGCTKDYVAAARMYRRAMALECGAACFALAVLYVNGDGVERDYDKASALLNQAGSRADTLGDMYIKFVREKIDTRRAIKAFEDMRFADFWRYSKTADRSNPGIQVMLGHCYEEGLGCEVNLDEAAKWYYKAKKQGVRKATRFAMRVDGLRAAEALQDKRYDDFWRFSKMADRDDPNFQVLLGVCCEYGLGCKKDLDEAAKWYGKAKERGLQKAVGSAMRVDTLRALEAAKNNRYNDFWRFSKTADRNDPGIQAMLGVFYEEGLGCKRNLDEAAKWYARGLKQGNEGFSEHLMRVNTERTLQAFKANRWKDGVLLAEMADRKNAELNYWIGYCYEHGKGYEKNLEKAVTSYEYAAQKGIAAAQFRYACCLMNGDGIIKSEAEAVQWLARSAEQNYPEALYWYGKCFEDGIAVKKDVGIAEKYYRLAAKRGSGLVKNAAMKQVTEIVTQKAKAAFRAEKWDEGFALTGEANQDDSEIAFFMAQCHLYGKGTKKDLEAAAHCCDKALASKYPQSEDLSKQINVERAHAAFLLNNWSRGLELSQKVDPESAVLLYWRGVCLENGYCMRASLEKAVEAYRAALAKGFTKADVALREAEDEIAKTPRKYREALAQFSVNLKVRFPKDKIVRVPLGTDIDRAIELCPDGGTLMLDAGEYSSHNYSRDRGHKITKNIRIVGMSPQVTTVKGRFWVEKENVDGVFLIENVKIVKAIQSGSFDSVALIGGSDHVTCIVNNCILDGSGVRLFGAANLIIYATTVQNCKLDGLYPPKEGCVILLDSVFRDLNSKDAMFLSKHEKVYADGLTIDSSSERGIYLNMGGMIMLRNSSIRNIKKGFFDFSSSKHHGVGLYVSDWTDPRPCCILDNVEFENCSDAGIESEGDVLAFNVRFKKCGKDRVGQITVLDKSPEMDMETFFAREFRRLHVPSP